MALDLPECNATIIVCHCLVIVSFGAGLSSEEHDCIAKVVCLFSVFPGSTLPHPRSSKTYIYL